MQVTLHLRLYCEGYDILNVYVCFFLITTYAVVTAYLVLYSATIVCVPC
jgi:hypothetical protein